MSDIRVGKGAYSEDFVTLTISNSKADQFNEDGRKTSKSAPAPVCPVKAIARLMTQTTWSCKSENQVFGKRIRNLLWATLRLAVSEIGIPASRIVNRSIRSGGAAAMWRAGYDIEVINRCGRWE